MPDIGMADLITPIQAGANIVAQANNIRRQREQMALQWQQQQARLQELQQLGQVRHLEAQKAQQELSNEKEKKAARIVFGESYNKAYSEYVKTKPQSTESERAEFALRSALPNAHPDDIPDIIKSVSASAMNQDKNAVAMQKAIAQMEANARLSEFRIDSLNARIEHFQKQAEQAERTLEERRTFHEAVQTLNTQKLKAEEDVKAKDRELRYVRGITEAGQRAYDGAVKAGGPTALQDATTAKARAERIFQERWNAESGYRPSTVTTNAATPKDEGNEGNVDTEANASDNEPIPPPPAKPTPKPPTTKKFKFDPDKGLVPVQ